MSFSKSCAINSRQVISYIKVIFALILCASASKEVFASTVPTGNVTTVIAANTFGLAYFTTNGGRSAKPACATTDNWVLNVSTPQGQVAFSTALTAKITAERITIVGTGLCSDDPTGETVQLISIN